MIRFRKKNPIDVINHLDQKVKIQYPCLWEFKLIGKNADDLKQAVHEVIQHRDFTFRSSNTSKNKKFISYSLSIMVDNQDDRDSLFKQLKDHALVVMVL